MKLAWLTILNRLVSQHANPFLLVLQVD